MHETSPLVINGSFWIEALLFFVVFLFLRVFLFDAFLKLYKERWDRSDGLLNEANKLYKNAQELSEKNKEEWLKALFRIRHEVEEHRLKLNRELKQNIFAIKTQEIKKIKAYKEELEERRAKDMKEIVMKAKSLVPLIYKKIIS